MTSISHSATSDGGLIKSEIIMRELGYADKSAFWAAVHRDGIPYIRQNSRRLLFERAAVNAWIDRKRVGGVAA